MDQDLILIAIGITTAGVSGTMMMMGRVIADRGRVIMQMGADLDARDHTIRRLNRRVDTLEQDNAQFAKREAKRLAQARAAAAKGKATQMAAAARRRAEREMAEAASTDKTVAALKACPPRPRDEVVAGVLADRKLRNSDAGVAATKGG